MLLPADPLLLPDILHREPDPLQKRDQEFHLPEGGALLLPQEEGDADEFPPQEDREGGVPGILPERDVPSPRPPVLEEPEHREAPREAGEGPQVLVGAHGKPPDPVIDPSLGGDPQGGPRDEGDSPQRLLHRPDDLPERGALGEPLRELSDPRLDFPRLPDEQFRGDASELAHHHGVEGEQEEGDEEDPREREPEGAAGDQLQHPEDHGEGEHLDDQDDRTSHDVGELEEMEMQDPGRHEVEKEQDREGGDRREGHPRSLQEIHRRHEAGDPAADEQELVLLPLDRGRVRPEAVPDHDVERESQVGVDVEEGRDVVPAGFEEPVVQHREGEDGAGPDPGDKESGVPAGPRRHRRPGIPEHERRDEHHPGQAHLVPEGGIERLPEVLGKAPEEDQERQVREGAGLPVVLRPDPQVARDRQGHDRGDQASLRVVVHGAASSPEKNGLCRIFPG